MTLEQRRCPLRRRRQLVLRAFAPLCPNRTMCTVEVLMLCVAVYVCDCVHACARKQATCACGASLQVPQRSHHAHKSRRVVKRQLDDGRWVCNARAARHMRAASSAVSSLPPQPLPTAVALPLSVSAPVVSTHKRRLPLKRAREEAQATVSAPVVTASADDSDEDNGE